MRPLFPGKIKLIVSEYQASNKSTVADEDGENKDWMEILNATASPVSLNGWYLTDKPGGVAGDVTEWTKWQFPNGITLSPGQTLLVWASNKNRKVVGQPLHTNFEFNANDDGAGLVNAQGALIDSHRWTTNQAEDRSAGWGIDNYVGAADGRARKLRFFGVPTPGALNTEAAYIGVCGNPLFSIPGGIFTGNPFPVTITVPPGTTARYTTDFTIPTATSPAVSGPITAAGTLLSAFL